ncbi:MAG: homogentisate 1,2-dioxygenase [Actinomycetota bacterium]
MANEVEYLSGFGNEHATEAEPETLPVGQNSPQRVAHDLYAEQLSGTSFTMPRALNRRTWMYRVRPSVRHVTGLQEIDAGQLRTSPSREAKAPVSQLRWSPIPIDPDASSTWVEGLHTVATNGDAHLQVGAATHLYLATRSMVDEVFVDADGELLIIPQDGGLRFVTELGVIEARPSEIVVIPRGIKFRVELLDDTAYGYVCENYGAPLELPDPGPIGLNAMALPRDFLYPTAACEADRPTRLIFKYDGRLLATDLEHTPLDVVAWHGNNAPYKYDLRAYCPVGPVLFDHPDPSIWTVLTSSSDTPGRANLDVVLFRERWLVAENTFRPPWFHSNVMSELMGNIEGVYDAKLEGFLPGGISIHNAFLPHGPDNEAFTRGTSAELEPVRMDDFLAFMFESRYAWIPTEWSIERPQLQTDYAAHWAPLDRVTNLSKP